MKNAMKKLLSLTLAVMLLLSVVPFQAFAAINEFGEMVYYEEDSTPAAPAAQPEQSNTQTVITDSVDNAVVYALPGELKSGDTAYVYFHIDGEEYKKVKTTVGAKFPALPSGKDALSFLGTTNGTSNGWAFKCWTWVEPSELGAAVNSSDIVNPDGLKVGGNKYLTVETEDGEKYYGEMHVYAAFTNALEVKLNPNGGKFAYGVSDTISIKIGENYPIEDMPIPVRSGYEFKCWAVADYKGASERLLVDGEDLKINSTARPYAVWERMKTKIRIDWYPVVGDDLGADETGWVAFAEKYENMPVPAGNKLSTSNGSFPTTAEINQMEMGEYTLKGWKFKKTGNDFKPDSTALSDAVIAANADANGLVEIVPKLQRTVYLIAKHPTKSSIATQKITVEIGSKIGELPAPASWAGDTMDDETYTFVKWVGQDGTTISNRENLKKTAEHPAYYPAMSNPGEGCNGNAHTAKSTDAHFDAEWEVSKVVQLYFHVDGKTSTYAKKVSCYDIPVSGSFNMHSLNLYKYFPDYTKYDDGVDVQYGWYTDAQWKNYCTGKPAATVCDELWNVSETKDLQELHIMLIDKGDDPQSYNNNNKTADKTNPKTGDIILAVVAVMVVAGVALAGIYFYTKKKRDEK